MPSLQVCSTLAVKAIPVPERGLCCCCSAPLTVKADTVLNGPKRKSGSAVTGDTALTEREAQETLAATSRGSCGREICTVSQGPRCSVGGDQRSQASRGAQFRHGCRPGTMVFCSCVVSMSLLIELRKQVPGRSSCSLPCSRAPFPRAAISVSLRRLAAP